ncbi:MAG: hypothetical protein EOO50_07275 [Flavobacterium sp.]|nr:MAG: hypothetical protein EOO50_07275 [Flavobacterium sp.]
MYDEVLFYDGYAGLVSEPTPEGVTRLRNDLFTRKLTPEELAQIGTTLTLNVTIKAACDNYDRIGNINLAMVPKGQPSYTTSQVQRIEMGRFITPFMNKNVMPDEVPYTFVIDNFAKILKDEFLNENYDFWVELQVFGVPYAAQEQVVGCAGRNDVFFGSLDFVTTGSTSAPTEPTFVLPLAIQANFNNYQTGATDAIGTTQRTLNFTLANDVQNAKIYFITSNHGAGTGGEEYVRRFHLIYFDEVGMLSYKPGGISCEPFRMYNTQGNGIYGSTPQSTSWWTAWNNWCPGNVIPLREISVGNLAAGAHSFKISVPSAQFVGQDGNFPLTVYVQGTGQSPLAVTAFADEKAIGFYPNPATDRITFTQNLSKLEAFGVDGKKLDIPFSGSEADVSTLPNGIFVLKGIDENGRSFSSKLLK